MTRALLAALICSIAGCSSSDQPAPGVMATLRYHTRGLQCALNGDPDSAIIYYHLALNQPSNKHQEDVKFSLADEYYDRYRKLNGRRSRAYKDSAQAVCKQLTFENAHALKLHALRQKVFYDDLSWHVIDGKMYRSEK